MLILKVNVSDVIGYCSGWCGQCCVCGDDPNNTDNDNNEGCRLGTASSLWSLGSLPGRVSSNHRPGDTVQCRTLQSAHQPFIWFTAILLVSSLHSSSQAPLHLCKLVLITRLDLDSQLALALKNFLPLHNVSARTLTSGIVFVVSLGWKFSHG